MRAADGARLQSMYGQMPLIQHIIWKPVHEGTKRVDIDLKLRHGQTNPSIDSSFQKTHRHPIHPSIPSLVQIWQTGRFEQLPVSKVSRTRHKSSLPANLNLPLCWRLGHHLAIRILRGKRCNSTRCSHQQFCRGHSQTQKSHQIKTPSAIHTKITSLVFL